MVKYDKQKIEFDRRMAFAYGLMWGLFFGFLIASKGW